MVPIPATLVPAASMVNVYVNLTVSMEIQAITKNLYVEMMAIPTELSAN